MRVLVNQISWRSSFQGEETQVLEPGMTRVCKLGKKNQQAGQCCGSTSVGKEWVAVSLQRVG